MGGIEMEDQFEDCGLADSSHKCNNELKEHFEGSLEIQAFAGPPIQSMLRVSDFGF
jgi:hypothetical protein